MLLVICHLIGLGITHGKDPEENCRILAIFLQKLNLMPSEVCVLLQFLEEMGIYIYTQRKMKAANKASVFHLIYYKF